MFDASNVSFICIFAGTCYFADLTEYSTFSKLLGDNRHASIGRRFLLLMNFALQVQLVCLVGQFSQFARSKAYNGIYLRTFNAHWSTN